MLSDAQLRKAKPGAKPYKLTDGGGLHLYVTPAGGKLWRLRYEIDGKEKLLSIGAYPDISLAEAREARTAAKAALREGRDPSILKKQKKLAGRIASGETFEVVAREWHTLQKPKWTKTHAYDVLHSLERDIFPELGNVPIADLTPPMVLAVLRKVEERGSKETARRLRQRMSGVFVFAISTSRATSDPAATVQKAMAPVKRGRFPAITDLEQARKILRDVDTAPAHPVTKLAMRILALTTVRTGTLTTTPWAEIDEIPEGETPVWIIPAERMKLKLELKDDEARDHLVPLSTQAVEAINVLRTITGRGPIMFPNTRHAHKPMSENALGYCLNRAGYHHRHVPHGWRSTFSTIMNELYPADFRIIDFMLAHVPKDDVEKAYNRAKYLKRRIELAQEWADLLMVDQLPAEDLLKGPRQVRHQVSLFRPSP